MLAAIISTSLGSSPQCSHAPRPVAPRVPKDRASSTTSLQDGKGISHLCLCFGERMGEVHQGSLKQPADTLQLTGKPDSWHMHSSSNTALDPASIKQLLMLGCKGQTLAILSFEE